MFRSSNERNVHERLEEDDLSDDEKETDNLHPLESLSRPLRIINELFYLWVFNIIKIGKLQFEHIPHLTKDSRANVTYKHWKNVYNERKKNNVSPTTLSMIWHSRKYEIITLLLLQFIGYSLNFLGFLVFTNNLYPEFDKINNNNLNINNISKYALIIFIIFSLRSIITSYVGTKTDRIITRFISCLYLSIYRKTLSLHLNECNKQQVINIVGSDLETVAVGFWGLLGWGQPIIYTLLLSIVALYFVVGVSAIFGIVFMVFIGIPMQLYGGYKLTKYSGLRMEYADKRIALITELIRGIRITKLSCYELPLIDRINQHRNEELSYVAMRNFYLSLIVLSNFLVPAMMLFITLTIYCFAFNYVVNTNITLFILMLFSMIQVVVRGFPVILAYTVSLLVASKRLDVFLERKSVDIDNNAYNDNIEYKNDNDNDNDNDIAIEIKDGTFAWMIKDEETNNDKIGFSLNNISIKIKRGKLIAIIGSVGSGKSSFLQSILNEMKCINGEINVNSDDIIYCSQTPYIRNVTLRENIILQLPFNEIKYKKCIISSALISDLNKLPNSDLTVIGEEGVNLSGGQKMRVAFARTLYRKSINNNNKKQIYLFDDPLSCVDVYVGKYIFLNGIYKYILNNKNNQQNITCLMVINSHLHLLKYFDEIIIMEHGEIKVHSSVKKLFSDKDNIDLLKYQHLLPNVDQITQNDDDDYDDDDDIKEDIDDFEINAGNDSYSDINSECDSLSMPEWNDFFEFIKCSITPFDYKSYWNDDTDKIKQCEDIQNNKMNLIKLVIPMFISFIILCFSPICDLWILYWHQQIEENVGIKSGLSTNTSLWCLSVWFILLGIIAFGTLYSMHFFAKLALKSSHYIHICTLFNILRANTLFFDMTPRGAIMHRFTSDTNMMDIQFIDYVYQFILWSSSIIGYLFLIIIFIPLSIIPIIILFPIIIYLNYKYQLSFFSAVLLGKKGYAQIITLFSETVSNLDSIRSYNLQSYFIKDLQSEIDKTRSIEEIKSFLTSWLALYQEILLNLIQLIVIIICIYQIQINTNINKQFVILSCWYFMAIQSQINHASRMYVFSKYAFTSVKRLMFYHNLFFENKKLGKEITFESKQINHQYLINKNIKWPNNGNIEINKLKLRYRRKFNIVLDIDSKIIIKHGDKIGICGRTGSGKSSILVSIFRLFEPEINNIIIDKYKIDKLGLYDLRSNLSIIAQNAILFTGTLRFNLDPFDKYSDNEIWNALQNVQLFNLINNRNGKLMCNVEANGNNFSIGEKQLLCFARAILSKSTILFMDESTSSVDKNTDNIIQNLIRSKQFKNITVICIAHRLQTIIDYDYILLLKNGKIKQFDKPQNLLNDKNGHFAKLLKTNMLYYNLK